MSKRAIVAAVLCAVSGPLLSYNEVTHQVFAAKAVEKTKLATNPSFREDLELTSLADTFPNSQGANLTVVDLVAFGAKHEDRVEPDERSVHHFFDPHNNVSVTVLGIPGGQKSPDWIIDGVGQSANEEYSYRKASEYFYKAMTSTQENERNRHWGLTFQTLGHVIHHIEDMAQPQHVRNDPHLDTTDIKPAIKRALLEPFRDPSLYESYTKDSSEQWAALMEAAPEPIKFPTVRSFWTNGSGTGMADFTNRNFVSKDSNFQIRSGQPAANAQYPAPVPLAGSGEVRTLVELGVPNAESLCQRLKSDPRLSAQQKECKIEFVASNVSHTYAGENAVNSRAASLSMFDQRLRSSGGSIRQYGPRNESVSIDRVFTLNRFNFDAAQKYLIPRAVAYSTGLIDHFFRGRLALNRVRSNGGGWIIRNRSAEQMAGTFSLHYEDIFGQRGAVSGGTYTGTVAGSSDVPFTFPEPPASSSKVIAVFSGQLGVGEPQVHVAGKVEGYPCGATYDAAGSSEGFDRVFEMGGAAGWVDLAFEAYQIPDALTLKSSNSQRTLLASTYGPVSGGGNFRIYFDPVALQSTKVRLQIFGNNNPDTRWTVTLQCPEPSAGAMPKAGGDAPASWQARPPGPAGILPDSSAQ